jgi:hypothetical protein
VISLQTPVQNWLSTESESYVTTDGQSASLSWNKAPIWGLWPKFHYCQTVEDLLIWVLLYDERTRLSFTITPGPRQRSHRVRVCPMLTKSLNRSHRKHSSYIVSFVSVAAGTCLASHWRETALVYPSTSRSLHSNGSTRHNIDRWILMWIWGYHSGRG